MCSDCCSCSIQNSTFERCIPKTSYFFVQHKHTNIFSFTKLFITVTVALDVGITERAGRGEFINTDVEELIVQKSKLLHNPEGNGSGSAHHIK
jgi:hypothetical protein